MRPFDPQGRGGRYTPGPIYSNAFTPEQLRYIQEELRKISGAINGLDDGFSSRWVREFIPFVKGHAAPSTKPDFDTVSVGLLFPQNDVTERAYGVLRLPQGFKPNSDIKVYIHWQQTGASFPTWVFEYKWYSDGDTEPGSFTSINVSAGEYSYVSGSLAQVSVFPTISKAGINSTSNLILFKLYRNDNVVTGDILTRGLDFHYQVIAPGSRNEFSDV